MRGAVYLGALLLCIGCEGRAEPTLPATPGPAEHDRVEPRDPSSDPVLLPAEPAVAAEQTEAATTNTDLQDRIDSVLPVAAEERFLAIPWRTNLMAARREAQATGKPIFLWIMVGNPQGCT